VATVAVTTVAENMKDQKATDHDACGGGCGSSDMNRNLWWLWQHLREW